jgi:hypothetical protein
MPHVARPHPSRIPSRWAHIGSSEAATATPRACKSATATSPRCVQSPLLPAAAHLLRNHFKSFADLSEKHREFNRPHRLLRIDDDVHRWRRRRPCQPNRLAQPPLHPVPIHSIPKHASHSESNAHAFAIRSPEIKDGHVGGEMPPPLLVNSLKVRVPQQTSGARILSRCSCRIGVYSRFPLCLLSRLLPLRVHGHSSLMIRRQVLCTIRSFDRRKIV